jgi:NADPH:quinone reductase-like Zn-dependent oxidoreductase
MRAVVLTAFGDVDKLVLRDEPEPTLGPNDVKVRVAGASINPVDWKIRSGSYKRVPIELPLILGRDVSGVIVELDSHVTGFAIGDRVMGLVGRGYAEIVVANAATWAAVPDRVDLVDAAALPLVLLTGTQLVEEAVNPERGARVLVTGAVGSVGRAAVFAAKERGAHVWAGVRRAQKAEAGKLEVEGVIALDDDVEISSLPELDSIADTVGGEALQRLLGRVKRGGTIGSILGEPAGAKERGLVVRSIMAHPDGGRLAELGLAVADGRLVIPIARRFPLAEARQAQTLAEGGAGGKVVLVA